MTISQMLTIHGFTKAAAYVWSKNVNDIIINVLFIPGKGVKGFRADMDGEVIGNSSDILGINISKLKSVAAIENQLILFMVGVKS